MKKLTVSKIATTLGLEETIIKNIISRKDEDLLPYVTQEPDENKDVDYVLDIEGLPLLIKKLSFNLPTTDIIENLACQVLHLTALEHNNLSLKEEIKRLNAEVEGLRQEVTALQNKIEEERSRSLKYKISKIFRYND